MPTSSRNIKPLNSGPEGHLKKNLHFLNPASLGFLFCKCSYSRQNAHMGCSEKPRDRHRHGAWRAAWVMLAFLCFGVNSGIRRPTFLFNKTACRGSCCQARLDLWTLFHRFQSIDVAALKELSCLIPCLICGPTLRIWVEGHACPSPLWIKGQLTKRVIEQKGSILLQLRKRLQILQNLKNTGFPEFELS